LSIDSENIKITNSEQQRELTIENEYSYLTVPSLIHVIQSQNSIEQKVIFDEKVHSKVVYMFK
jgi:hypothetical protein